MYVAATMYLCPMCTINPTLFFGIVRRYLGMYNGTRAHTCTSYIGRYKNTIGTYCMYHLRKDVRACGLRAASDDFWRYYRQSSVLQGPTPAPPRHVPDTTPSIAHVSAAPLMIEVTPPRQLSMVVVSLTFHRRIGLLLLYYT